VRRKANNLSHLLAFGQIQCSQLIVVLQHRTYALLYKQNGQLALIAIGCDVQRRVSILICAIQVEILVFEIFAHALQVVANHGSKKVFVQVLRFGFFSSLKKAFYSY
jgi:hypothetical protein